MIHYTSRWFNRSCATIPLLFMAWLGGIALRPIAAADPPRIYKSRIEPHWFGDNARFWYRNDLPQSRQEFIVVDAAAGTRRPAFDHAQVAAALSQALGVETFEDRLPVELLEFSSDRAAVVLTSRKHAWRYDLQKETLESVPAPVPESLPTDLKSRPTRRTGRDTEITFVNQLEGTVELLWLEPGGGRRSYGRLEPGAERVLHSYAGHRWLVVDERDVPVACVEAQDRSGLAVIDGKRPPPDPAQDGGPAAVDSTEVPSPDGRFQAFVRDENLFVREVSSGEERRLSGDGSAAETYRRDAVRSRAVEMAFDTPDPPPSLPEVYWSPDATRLLAIRTRVVSERRAKLLESSPREGLLPRLHTYPYFRAGDELPLRQPRLFDVSAGKALPIDDALFANPWNIDGVRWRDDSTRVTFVYNERGHQTLRIVGLKAVQGAATVLIDERSPTFIDYSGKLFVAYLDDSREILWMSERDGWNHLYLYDAETGRVKNQITRGEWVVRGVDHVDPQQRVVWFRAGGIRPDQDPYHEHWARIGFDGSGLVLLTEGDGTHQVEWSPDRRFLIDTWSRADLPPVIELRRAVDGGLVCPLETADASERLASDRPLPERFVAPGRDGQTPIHGLIHRPRNFDPRKKYPVIENIYSGPHAAHVPKSFRAAYGLEELADRGVIIVQIDGMGTSHRSKAFHDVCWKNLADAGFPDRIAWIRAAAAGRPEMDLGRVGIYGGSAGGQNALRALLAHGDFYQVAVADCGCHDNRMDKIWWNEQWMGWPVGPHYAEQSNVTQAHRLQGKLMLVVGELDRNVDPASTMQVVDALVRADKDFDLVIIPGAGHGAAETSYGRRRRSEFLARHLLEQPPTQDTALPEE
ncbi:MAG: prolyl oligopeptidase family serine peptidase [Planctomycetales bacterium]